MKTEYLIRPIQIALTKLGSLWQSDTKGKCALVGCAAVVLLIPRAECTGGETEGRDSGKKECAVQSEVSSVQIAEKLFARYNPSEGLLLVLHSGSGRTPLLGSPYFIGANGFTKLCDGDGYDVFTDRHDLNDIYYDFCVTSSRSYVSGQTLSPGYYVYTGTKSYITVSGAKRTLHSFVEVEGEVMRHMNRLLSKVKEEQRAVAAKQYQEEKVKEAKRLESLEQFVIDHVGIPFWSAPPKEWKNSGDNRYIISLKKKFRYCDKAILRCTYGDVNKITDMTLFGVLDKQYAYETLKKEAATMLAELDQITGEHRGDWSVKRRVQDKFEYESNIHFTQDMIYLNPSLPRKQCVGITISRLGPPPKDGVLTELPPLE